MSLRPGSWVRNVSVAPQPTRSLASPMSPPRSLKSRGPIRQVTVILFLVAWTPLLTTIAVASDLTWSTRGPKAKGIEAIARDPLNPARMWAGSFGSGVYRSTDGGTTWTASRTGLVNTFVRALACNPRYPDSLFCGTNDGVWLSVDGGVNWNRLLSTNQSVRAIAIHPSRTATMYAATYGLGVFKSVNGGKNWSAINLGLANTNVRDVVLHPTKPDTLFAATSGGGGVHRSFNGGLTWSQVPDTSATMGAVEQISIDPANPLFVYAATLDRGVLKSPDGGTTWVRINRGLTSFRGRSIALADTFRYFGTADSGLYVTTASDSLWHRSSVGLADSTIDCLLAVGGSATIWAGTGVAGVFRSDNRATSWTQLDGGLLATAGFALAVRPSTHSVYAGTGFGDQFWTSADFGASWTRAVALFSHDSERAVVLDPIAPGTIYLASYGAAVYRSDDDGRSWRDPDSLSLTLTNRFVRPLIAVPGESGHLLAGTGNGVFESMDGAQTWTPRSTGLPTLLSVRALALGPGAPLRVFAGSDSSGVFRSDDGGLTWAAKSVGLLSPFVHAILVDAVNPLVVYAGTDSGVVKSTNAGDLWTPIRNGLPLLASVRDLVQDPSRPQAIFAAVFGSGVYETLDGGAHWFSLFSQSGLANLNVRALALDSALQTIYAGTEAGVAAASRYPISAVTGVESGEGVPLFRLQAAPLPMRQGILTVRYEIPTAGIVEVALYNVRGERVRLLHAPARESAGPHTLLWDGRAASGARAAAGVYFLSLRAPAGRRTAKVLLLR